MSTATPNPPEETRPMIAAETVKVRTSATVDSARNATVNVEVTITRGLFVEASGKAQVIAEYGMTLDAATRKAVAEALGQARVMVQASEHVLAEETPDA